MSRLSVKLMLGVILSVLLIEAVLFILSVNVREESLLELQNLELATHGSVSIFSQENVDSELARYRRNIVGLTFVVALFVAGGFFVIYYWFVGRYIEKIYHLNNDSRPLKTKNGFRKIPNDEMGLLIRSRFNMLDRLEKEIKSNRQLLRILSHDLNNLLTVVMGNAGLLLGELDGKKYQQAVATAKSIQSAGQKQKELIDAVLTLESTRRSHAEHKLKHHSLVDIVYEALGIFEGRAQAKRLRLNLECDPGDSFPVKTDKALLLNNVLCNLLSNAIKFSFPGDTIDVIVRRDSRGDIEIVVKDNGIGIPEAILESLSGGEEIISRAGTSNEAGTGFGVLILMETANALGLTVAISSVSIEEDPENHGSEIQICFGPAVSLPAEISGTRQAVLKFQYW